MIKFITIAGGTSLEAKQLVSDTDLASFQKKFEAQSGAKVSLKYLRCAFSPPLHSTALHCLYQCPRMTLVRPAGSPWNVLLQVCGHNMAVDPNEFLGRPYFMLVFYPALPTRCFHVDNV